MEHNHKFPQLEKFKQNVRAELRYNRKMYIGLGVGFLAGVLVTRRPYVVVLVNG
jgi:hypothetical protein